MSNQYSPADVKLSLAGIQNLRGWNNISITRTTENYSQQSGADGTVSVTASADKTGTMEISVQQTNTEFHLAMAALQQLIDQYPEETITFSVNCIERNGGNTAILSGVRLNMMAGQNFAAEQEDRTYPFLVERIDYVPTPEGLVDSAREVATVKSFIDTIKLDVGIA